MVATPAPAQTVWTGTAGDGNWQTASNWSTNTAPYQAWADVAFNSSGATSVTATATPGYTNLYLLNSIDFGATAGPTTITLAVGVAMDIAPFGSGVIMAGIVNNSASTQTIVTSGDTDPSNTGGSQLSFQGSTVSSGNLTIVNQGTTISDVNVYGYGGVTTYYGGASAGTSNITNEGSANTNGYGSGQTIFHDNSTAGNATIYNNGGETDFLDTSTAGNAVITNSDSGLVYFANNSTGGNATISGGTVQTADSGTLGNATITATSFYLEGGTDNSGASLTLAALTPPNGATLQIYLSDPSLTLHVGALAASSSASYIYFGSGNLAVGALNTNTAIASSFEGTGDFTKEGTGTLTLTGDLTDWTGTLYVNAGTLRLGDGTTSGSYSASNAVTLAGGNLVFDPGSSLTFASPIGGAGSLTKIGGGTLDLTGSNTFVGTTSVTGGLLEFSSASAFGASGNTLYINGGGVEWGHSTTVDISGFLQAIGPNGATFNTNGNNVSFASGLSGTGGIVKGGSGTLTLDAASSYAGSTEVSAGTLALASSGTIGSGALKVDGGTLALGGKSVTVGAVTISSGTISGGTLTGSSYALGGGTLSAVLAGSAAATVTASTTLSGANTFSGGTTINSGTLTVSNASGLGTGAVNVNGGTLTLSTAATTGALTLTSGTITGSGLTASSFTLESGTDSGGLAGAGAATKTTTGTVTLSGSNTFTGGLTIGSGTVRATAASALGTGGVTLDNGTALQLANNSATTFNGAITYTDSGTASIYSDRTTAGAGVTQTAGTLTLGGGQLSLLAGSDVSSGTAGIKFGSTTLTSAGQIAIGASVAATFASISGTNENLTVNATGGGTVTGALSLGTGSLSKSGAGTLTLSGAETYSGGTTVTAGLISLGATASLGSGSILLNGGGIQWAATPGSDLSADGITLGSSGGTIDTQTFSGTFATAISGTGSLTKVGSGTLTLTAANGYSGGTTISAGAIALGSNGTLGTGSVSLTGSGSLNLGGASIAASSLSLNTTGSLSNGTLTGTAFNLQAGTVSASIGGSGALTKTGTGTLALAGANTYGGGTSVTGGTLSFSNGGALGSGAITVDAATLQWGTGMTTDLSSRLTLGPDGATLDTGSNTVSFASGVSGGALTKIGSGTLTLNAASSYTGGTTVNAGTLTLGSSGTLGTGALTLGTSGSVDLGGGTQTVTSLALSTTGTLSEGILTASSFNLQSGTISAALAGTGPLTKTTTGTVNLLGANTFSGAISDQAGVIELSNAGALGNASNQLTINGGGIEWGAGITTDISANLQAIGSSGATFNTNGNNVVLANALAGTGTLTKTGAGTLTLTGGYSGSIAITGGTFETTVASALGGQVTTVSGGTLEFIANSNYSSSAALPAISGSSTFEFDRSSAGSAVEVSVGASSLASSATLTVQNSSNITSGTSQLSISSLALAGNGGLSTGSSSTELILGNVVVPTAKTLTLSGAGVIEINGVLSGNATFTQTSGTTILSNTANTIASFINIDGGTVEVSSMNNFGVASSIGASPVNTSAIYLGQGATSAELSYIGSTNSSSNRTFYLDGTTGSGILDSSGTGTVSYSGAVSFAAGSKSLVLSGNNTGRNILSGAVTGVTGASLLKSGGGTWALTGSGTTVSSTSVSGGTLIEDGSWGGSAVSVGAHATLAGNGTIGALTLASQSTLSLGDSLGKLTVSGAASLAGGSTIIWQVDEATGSAGTNWGELNVTGGSIALTGGGAITIDLLSITSGGAAAALSDFDGTKNYTFALATSSSGITGYAASDFVINSSGFESSDPGAWSVVQNGNELDLSYSASAVPEPAVSAAAMAAATMGLALAWRWRRTRLVRV